MKPFFIIIAAALLLFSCNNQDIDALEPISLETQTIHFKFSPQTDYSEERYKQMTVRLSVSVGYKDKTSSEEITTWDSLVTIPMHQLMLPMPDVIKNIPDLDKAKHKPWFYYTLYYKDENTKISWSNFKFQEFEVQTQSKIVELKI